MAELDLTPVFVIGCIFGGWALILHIILSNRIKRKIIEVGNLDINPNLVKSLVSKDRTSSNSLKWGIIGTFSGIGLLIIHLLSNQDAPALFFAIEIIAASLGFLTYFFLQNKFKN